MIEVVAVALLISTATNVVLAMKEPPEDPDGGE
jgi:hypothetical protein